MDYFPGTAWLWLRNAFCLVLVCCNLAFAGETPAAADDDSDEIDLAEIVRRPTIGNYRGYAEFKMAHYAQARRIWEALDAQNFGEAAFNLGMLYEDGLGVVKDIPRALAYYRRGADNGSRKAVFRLGLVYWLGTPDVPRDAAIGRHYLELAAAAGDDDAVRYLAADVKDALVAADRAIAEGKPEEALRLLTAAANAGDHRAQTRLGWAYEAGRGVPRDLARAAAWFKQAAEAGNGEAMYALAVMYATGAGQVKDAALAAGWLRKSAAAGYAPAIDELKAH
ncbi:MAG: sel1 repeat family protein [Betaproteobacteria bacterium HGW-Betaproteobacteria-11]|nr:MAG: sel1 repeat family protein [Betaproteobacteria bacterium HGW-Betaproteobacteria-11]